VAEQFLYVPQVVVLPEKGTPGPEAAASPDLT